MSFEQHNTNGSGDEVVQGALCVVRIIKNTAGSIKELFLCVEEQKAARWKKKGQLSIPGGRTEEGENIIDTITRELQEEAGIIVNQPQDLTSIGTIIIKDSQNVHHPISAQVFTHVTDNNHYSIIQDDEVMGKLYTKEQLCNIITHDVNLLRPGLLESLYLNISNSPKNVITIEVTNGSYKYIDPTVVATILQHYS